MSKEKLQESMEEHYSRLVAEQLAKLFSQQFKEQWDTVIFELAATRRSNEHLKATVNDLREHNNRLENLISNLETANKITLENQRRASEILKTAEKELE